MTSGARPLNLIVRPRASMVCLLVVQREAQAVFASVPEPTNRAAVATTARHVVAFGLGAFTQLGALRRSCWRCRFGTSLGVVLHRFFAQAPCAGSQRQLSRGATVAAAASSRIIAAMMRCLPMPRFRPNPAFNADAPSTWLHMYSRMRASLRRCASRWRAG